MEALDSHILSVSMKCDRCGRMTSMSDISWLKESVPVCAGCRKDIWDKMNDDRFAIKWERLEDAVKESWL